MPSFNVKWFCPIKATVSPATRHLKAGREFFDTDNQSDWRRYYDGIRSGH